MNRIKWVLLLGILAGPVLAFFGWEDMQRLDKIEKEGKTVPGIITSGEWKQRKGNRTYKFDVAYQPEGGRPVTKQFTVSSSFAKTKTDGTNITDENCQVRYVVGHPDQAIVVGGSTDQKMMLGIGGGWALAGLLTGVFLLLGRKA